MPSFRTGAVTELLSERAGLQRVRVDLGETEPDAMAKHVNSLVTQAARDLEGAETAAIGSIRDAALARLRRLCRME